MTLIHPGASPGKCYPLNRFLLLLLHEYASARQANALFFDEAPPQGEPREGRTLEVLAHHELVLDTGAIPRDGRPPPGTTYFDHDQEKFIAAARATPGGLVAAGQVVSRSADALIIRHGVQQAPMASIAVADAELRVGLGRFALPYVSVD